MPAELRWQDGVQIRNPSTNAFSVPDKLIETIAGGMQRTLPSPTQHRSRPLRRTKFGVPAADRALSPDPGRRVNLEGPSVGAGASENGGANGAARGDVAPRT